ncbi:MAG: hypothetical protein HFJ29_04045 [Clostridia bacterium]|nr:hypothetical protein [Clostridia bacterium]
MLKYSSCADWHGASYSDWFSSNRLGFARGGEMFSFTDYSWDASYAGCGRGVAVVKSAVRAELVTDDLCDGAKCSVRHWTLI